MYLELLYVSSICFMEFLLTSLLGSSIRMALQGAATKACACNWDLAVYPDRFFIFLAVNPGLVGSSSEGMES